MAKIRRYTSAQLQFLEEAYRRLPVPELTSAFNDEFSESRSQKSIHAALKNHGFTRGKPDGRRSVLGAWTSKIFTREEAGRLAEAYKTRSRKELTQWANDTFGKSLTVAQVTAFVKNHKLRSGRTARFKRGHVPWNAGIPGSTPGSHTSFQPGHVPDNINPLYHERIDSKDNYILIKVPERNPHTGAATRYLHKHRWLWQQAHGPIPENRVVIFRDGDNRNFDLSNLELIDRSLLVRLNKLQHHQAPAEVRPTIKMIAKLQNRASALARESTHE